MKKTITVLTILWLMITSAPACSFRVSTENNNQTASNAAKVEENAEAEKKIASADSDSSVLSQTSGRTGTYKYKNGGIVNEISVQELQENKLRVEIYASYEYEINGNLNANVGEAKGTAALNGNTAVFLPEDTEGCEITLRFSGSKIVVNTKRETNCGYGLNVTADGTYTKTSGKPNFDDSDGNSNNDASSSSNAERISFAKGKSSAAVSGKITKDNNKIYVIGARAGQTLEIKITDGGANNDVVFSLYAPDGSNLISKDPAAGYDTAWRGKLPKNGDYKIEVGAIESENVNFKMSVSIR